jgi:hypothetical protein
LCGLRLPLVACVSCGLDAHPIGVGSKSKTGLISSGFDYLGYEFIGSRITVRRASVHNLEARIVRVFTAHRRAVEASKGRAWQ